MPTIPFRFLWDATQKSYLIHMLLLVQSILITSLTLLFAHLGFSIPGQCLATVLGMLPFSIILTGLSLRQHPGMLHGIFFGRTQNKIESHFQSTKKHNLIFDIVGKVGLFTDNILIAWVIGVEKVTVVILTTRLLQITTVALQSFGSASWAGLADIYAKGQDQLFKERVLEISRLISIFCIASLVPIAAFNKQFVALWVGSQNFGGMTLTALAAINAALLALISFWAWCFTGTGNIRFLIPSWTTWAVVNFSASLVFTKTLGIIGPLLGTCVANCLVLLWTTPFLLNRVFSIPVGDTLKAVFGPLIIGVPFAMIIGWISTTHIAGYWIFLEVSLSGGGFLLLSWSLLLDADTRKRWKARFISH